MNIVGKSLEDLLTSNDAKDRVLGRFYATGVMEIVENWVSAEMNVPGRDKEDSQTEAAIVHTLMFSFVATICSFMLALGRVTDDYKAAGAGFGKIVGEMYEYQFPLHLKHKLAEAIKKAMS